MLNYIKNFFKYKKIRGLYLKLKSLLRGYLFIQLRGRLNYLGILLINNKQALEIYFYLAQIKQNQIITK